MKPSETGGPAFPCETHRQTPYGKETTRHSGVTIRDYFATEALKSVLVICINDTGTEEIGYPKYCAHKAYEMADAMLKARGDQ